MIFCSVLLAVVFLIIFIVSARNGQFDDDESPAVRILLESEIVKDKGDKEQKLDIPSEEKKVIN